MKTRGIRGMSREISTFADEISRREAGSALGSAADEFDEVVVRLGLAQAGDGGLAGFLDLGLHEGAAEKVDRLEALRLDEELFLAGAGGLDVDSGPEAELGALAVED